jgi:hypothetical protein
MATDYCSVAADDEMSQTIVSSEHDAVARFIVNPVIVLRTGGLPISASTFPSGSALACQSKAAEDAAKITALSQIVCQQLESLLPAAFALGVSCGRAILGTKRALFNGKLPNERHIADVAMLFDEELSKKLQKLTAMLRAPSPARVKEDAYHAELEAGIQSALGLTKHPLLRRGIEVANAALLKRMEQFESTAVSMSRKDRDQLALRLVRYALRSSQKTSPLSSLGLVALCRTETGAGWHPLDQPISCAPIVHHAAHVSHSALEAILVPLISEMANLDPATPICLNSSLEQHAKGFRWWRIRRNEPVDWRVRRTKLDSGTSDATLLHVLYRLAANQGSEQLSIRQMKSRLASILPIAMESRLDPLLEELWRLGVIEPDLPLTADPLELARSRIAALEPTLARALTPPFETLCAMLTATSDGKLKPVRDIEAAFGNLVEAAGNITKLSGFRPILLENCTSPEPSPAFADGLLNDALPGLSLLTRLAPLLAADSPMGRMRRFALAKFVAEYGSGQSISNCLPFLRGCAAEVDEFLGAAPEKRRENLAALRAADPRYDGLLDTRNRFLDKIATAASRSKTVSFHAADLEEFAGRSVELATSRIVSHMYFLQPCVEAGRALYVLNQIYPGAASTYSRFLEKRDDLVSSTVEYLAQISENGGFHELTESFCFNAASYRRLSKQRVSIPPHHVDSDDVVSIASLGIRHREEFNDLVFVNENGVDLSIFYPAVMSPFTMARAQQVVRALGSWVEMIDELWQSIALRVQPDADGVRHLARVEIDNLVIIRACIICPQHLLPSADLPTSEFFFNLSDWAKARGLARQLFVRKYAQEDAESVEAEVWGKPPGKSGKPMPVDLDCPISVLAFQKDLAQTSDHIVFTEALPSREQFVAIRSDEPVVSELGIEITMILNAERSVGDD